MTISQRVRVRSRQWLLVIVVVMAVVVMEVAALSGPNVCMVKQKYNITKRIKYRAPMSVRTYEWCFNMPPRCSRWNTEMRDLTRLETEERTAEVAVCCPGYKMKDVSCVTICPLGKTGHDCSEDCMPDRWGPNCVHECRDCTPGECSVYTGECICQEGWQGESCEIFISITKRPTTPVEDILTTSIATKTTTPSSTEFMLVTTPKSIVAETTSRTIITTVPTSTTRLTTPKVEPTTRLTTSTIKLDDHNITTPSASTIRVTISDKDMNSSPVDIQPDITTNKAELFNNEDSIVIPNKTVKQMEITKSTYLPAFNTSKSETIPAFLTPTTNQELNTTIKITTTDAPTTKMIETTRPTFTNATIKYEYTRKPDTTVKMFPTTLKFKPKEIWIRPAQKGELPTTETKTKANHDLSHVKFKNAAKIEILPITTPKTIIVSIIPTSVSYATFKKIALTTATYTSQKNHIVHKANNKAVEGFTKSMSVETSTTTPSLQPINATFNSYILTPTPSIINVSASTPHTTSATTRRPFRTNYSIVNKTTNSMSRTSNVVTPKLTTSNSLTTSTTSLTNITSYSHRRNVVTEKIPITANIETSSFYTTERSTKILFSNEKVEVTKKNITKVKADKVFETILPTQLTNKNETNIKTNVATSETNTVTTDKPAEDEEKFHILTEPEHITAVMSDKETERSSVDLISVISIAGGVMMAVITVAVIIVMMERCRRPRYDNVRKINDIRMQVMIDNNDEPPPYVRSIFHTPLPDPPSEKCHYQPISTLDRNLKQFMRPVVVQTISPMMLENFRGILECHYDHLPRRSHDYGKMPTRCSVAPSIEQVEQHHLQRASLTDSAIDALKCEAKLDVIDSTTSEPLYAEIPCWRPPSEHAIEIINNLNGEAVTEL